MKPSTYSWSLNFKCRAGWPQTSFFISKRLQQALIISVALDKGSVMGQMKNCLCFFTLCLENNSLGLGGTERTNRLLQGSLLRLVTVPWAAGGDKHITPKPSDGYCWICSVPVGKTSSAVRGHSSELWSYGTQSSVLSPKPSPPRCAGAAAPQRPSRLMGRSCPWQGLGMSSACRSFPNTTILWF